MSKAQREWIERLAVLRAVSGADRTNRDEKMRAALRIAKNLLDARPQSVSVIMPMWNREKIVLKAIESALEQTYPPAEIIVSDDGSSDGSVEAVKAAFPRQIEAGVVKLIENGINRGAAHARNAAQALATGEIIAYLDSDNTWRRNYLLLMAALFAECEELDCAYAGLNVTNRDLNKRYTLGEVYDRKRLLKGNYIDMNIFMHRKRVSDALGGFNVDIVRIEDWEMIIRYTQAQVPPFLPVLGTDYLIDTENLGNVSSTTDYHENFRKVYEIHKEEMNAFGYVL